MSKKSNKKELLPYSSHSNYMQIALKEAEKAFNKNEVPVGAVIVDKGGNIIAKSHNLCEKYQNPTKHAEMLAIDKATKKLGKSLKNCSIFVTLEPCAMCAQAISYARISNIYYAAGDSKFGAIESNNSIFNNKSLFMPNIYSGIGIKQSQILLKQFFSNIRN